MAENTNQHDTGSFDLDIDGITFPDGCEPLQVSGLNLSVSANYEIGKDENWHTSSPKGQLNASDLVIGRYHSTECDVFTRWCLECGNSPENPENKKTIKVTIYEAGTQNVKRTIIYEDTWCKSVSEPALIKRQAAGDGERAWETAIIAVGNVIVE